MSDLEHFTITYTSISSDDGSLDVGSPGVIVYGYDRLPMHPPSPDYVPGPEHPPLPVYVPYVPEPTYLEFRPLEDDVLPVEEQPLPAAVLPTTDSPGYIPEFDPEEDLEEDDDEDLADYPTDRDDDEEDESYGDDADEEDEDEEEEEHLAPADSVPPPQTGTRGARMTVWPQPPMAASTKALIVQLPLHYHYHTSSITTYIILITTTSIITISYSQPMIRLRAESPSTSHPLPLPLPIVLPRTRVSMAMIRAAAPATYCLAPRSETPPSRTPPLLPIPLPTSSPPLLLPSTNYKVDVPEVTLPSQKRLCVAPNPRYEIGESSSAPTTRPTGGFRADYGFVGTLDVEIRHDLDREIGYGITDVWVDPDDIIEEIPATDVAKLGQRMTDFVDTNEIYGRLNDAQDDRSLMSDQLNLLCRDRRSHARTARLMESAARASREAWQTIDEGTTRRGTDSDEDIADSNGSTTESEETC
ncbi:hypothetical protein Tco_1508057 [Tanacetum coccineum]